MVELMLLKVLILVVVDNGLVPTFDFTISELTDVS